MMKRIWALLLALALALGLTACGGMGGAPSQFPEGPASLPVAEEAAAPGSDAPDIDTPAPEPPAPAPEAPAQESEAPAVDEDGCYHTKDEVALYIHLYGHLPDNYVTKQEARRLGWSGGSVEDYAGEGAAIGGGRFGNYEGLLPEKQGRTYLECDIDTVGSSSRGARRIVYSNDGLVYYTEDHYESFELLYGEPQP